MKKSLINGKEKFPILNIEVIFPENKDWNEDLKSLKEKKKNHKIGL